MRRGSRTQLVVLAVVAGVLAQLGAVAVNALTSAPERWPGGLDLIRRYPFWAAIVLTVAVIAVGVVSALRQESTGDGPDAPALPPVPGWVVGRPAELDRIVRALRRGGDDPVAITTAVRGAGGFGKTILAALVCADRRVRRRFRGRIYVVTMGRDVRGRAGIAAKVGEVTRFITGDRETFSDPQLAGAHLGRLLNQRGRCLLVVDDVWEEEQVAPFLVGGRRCARLVTTRIPSAVPASAAVVVDQMTAEQAERVLTWELPSLPVELVELLLALSGRWPLLLRLANRAMVAEVATGRSAEDAAVDLAETLRAGGPAAVDDLADRVGALDMDVPEERARAVRATIEASVGLLPADGMARLTELGVFAEDETVPVELVERLWRATAGLDAAATRALCRRMAGLALVNLSGEDGGLVSLHDVVRAYLRALLDADQLAGLNAALLDARAADGTAWWDLGEADRYLRDHAVSHMVQAGRVEAAEQVATDLRWIGARLRDFGPVAPVADLAVVPTGRARYLHAQLTQMSHLLTPTDPESALTGVLLSRTRDVPAWREQAEALLATTPGPLLASAWPAPDAPDPAQIRTFSGHTGFVWAAAVAPDGSWLATGGEDRVVRTWNVATGQPGPVYIGHRDFVRSLAIAPDGTWFASGCQDNTIRIWDVATRRVRTVLTGHKETVWALAISPDGTWLVSSGDDGTVRRWDVATGRTTGVLTSHGGQARAMAMAPDGTWVASASGKTIRVTQVATGETDEFTAGEPVTALAAAPDGSWLAVAQARGPVRLWDVTRAEPIRALAGTEGGKLAIPAHGDWLASAGYGGVNVWSLATGALTATLTGHAGEVYGLAAAPDGAWVASAGEDSTIRIWDAHPAEPARPTLARAEVRRLAAPADGAWFVTAARGGAVTVWTAARAEPQLSLDAGSDWPVVAAAPDGTWFATEDSSGTLRLHAPDTGAPRAVFKQPPSGFVDLAVDADGARIALLRSYVAKVLDLATGDVADVRRRPDLPWLLDLLPEWYEAAALAPDGSWLAISRDDELSARALRRRGTIRLRNAATGRRIGTLSGHNGGVVALLAAPDGSWLASAGDDSTVRVWDLASRRTLRVLHGHTGTVTALAIAGDGGLLASVDEYGQVRVWDDAGRTVTMTRVDGRLNACAWVDGGAALAVGGVHGVYLFRFRRH